MAQTPSTARNKEEQRHEGGQAMDKAREATFQAGTKAREAVSSVAQAAGHTADSLAASAGSGMRSLADTISRNAPHEGLMGDASKTVARTLRQGGKYLEREALSGLMEDLGTLIRNHPLSAVMMAVGLGYLICATFRD